MKRLVALTFILSLLTYPVNSFANHDGKEHSHEGLSVSDKPLDAATLTVLPNEAVIEAHGIVCSFCSVGVQKKLSKLPFIDTSKYTKGVHVEIEKQKVTVAIKPGEKADVKAMYDSIISGGYSPVQAWVADAQGKVVYYDVEGK